MFVFQSHSSDTNPALTVRQNGTGAIFRALDGTTEVFSIADGGDITLAGGVDLVLATTTGTKIGTATNQLLAFYGVTPVDQPATIVDADGSLADATTKINTIIDRIQELGLIAT